MEQQASLEGGVCEPRPSSWAWAWAQESEQHPVQPLARDTLTHHAALFEAPWGEIAVSPVPRR